MCLNWCVKYIYGFLGDSAILTASPETTCGNDPCQTSGCYTDEASKCYVTLGCAPLFVDAKGEKIQCRGKTVSCYTFKNYFNRALNHKHF